MAFLIVGVPKLLAAWHCACSQGKPARKFDEDRGVDCLGPVASWISRICRIPQQISCQDPEMQLPASAFEKMMKINVHVVQRFRHRSRL